MDIIVAVPSDHPGGLEAPVSGHFGHCEAFTLVTLGEGGVKNVEVVPPAEHVQGGCMAPVSLLAARGVQALIAQGMGGRPLQAFIHSGIAVLRADGPVSVGQSIDDLLANRLVPFDSQMTCGGGH